MLENTLFLTKLFEIITFFEKGNYVDFLIVEETQVADNVFQLFFAP